MSDYIVTRAFSALRAQNICPEVTKRDLKALLKIFLQATLEEMSYEGKVKLQGIGTLNFCAVKGSTRRDLSGASRYCPEHTRVQFKAAQKLRSTARKHIMPEAVGTLVHQCSFCRQPSGMPVCASCTRQLKGDGVTNMMEKNAVLGNNKLEKTAALKELMCPTCGQVCTKDSSIPKCPRCGTAPFEARTKDDISSNF